jgi:hypothetical protein
MRKDYDVQEYLSLTEEDPVIQALENKMSRYLGDLPANGISSITDTTSSSEREFIAKCMKRIDALQSRRAERTQELHDQVSSRRHTLVGSLQKNCKTVSDLDPHLRTPLLQFYLTKGLYHSDGFVIDSPGFFWFLQTTGIIHYEHLLTSVEISNMWLLHGRPSCTSHIGFWMSLPLEDTSQFVLYDDLKYPDFCSAIEDYLFDVEEYLLPFFKLMIYHDKDAIDYYEDLFVRTNKNNECIRFMRTYFANRHHG